MPENILIQLLVVVSLALALAVVTVRQTVHAAALLAGFLLSVAGLYLVLAAEFIAAVQVLLYAGGVLVLTVFCIFLVSSWAEKVRPVPRARLMVPGLAAAVFGLLLLLQLAPLWKINAPELPPAGPGTVQLGFANPARLGALLVSGGPDRVVVSFEVLSILLLCALVGAVMLSRMYSRE